MMGWIACACEVKRRVTIAGRRMNSPTDATTFANGGASRSGPEDQEVEQESQHDGREQRDDHGRPAAIGVPDPSMRRPIREADARGSGRVQERLRSGASGFGQRREEHLALGAQVL